ncbi:MAG: ABC transporter substrate-binding protein [Symploca sp. SIO3C6]|nr:ABC transporter substrate-binding protein [Symploca sp. SIO3C6]
MDRRNFLKYISLAAGGFSFTACGTGNFFNSSNRDLSSELSKKDIFGKLEKTYLTLGIVPVIDCAPLIIAQKEGFFKRYGLTVGFSKQGDWKAVQDALIKGSLDASVALFGMPMLAQLGKVNAPMVSLMLLNLNGSSITLAKKVWEAGIRPSIDYFHFQEFASAYRKYIRGLEEPPKLAIDFPASMDNYNCRYWLSAMGINPDKDVEMVEFAPSQMIYKIQAGIVNGYCVSEPWNQQAAWEKAGFTSYISRNIWKGHPGKVLATMQSWIEKHPNTARALVAAVLEACQFCDQLDNRQSIAQKISGKQYLDSKVKYTEASLIGNYNYGSFDQKQRLKEITDLYIFHFQDTDYLKPPNHANYPWRSYGIWLLTQMIRWRQSEMRQYPADADEIIDRIYPVEVYEDTAKALEIKLPSERLKVEPAEVFIDKREFDPSQPVEYLNSFTIRAGSPQLFALS